MTVWTNFKREKNFIAGIWVGASSGKTVNVIDPATGESIGVVPDSGTEDADRAIAAATASFGDWSRTTADYRSKLMRQFHQCIMDNREALAELLTREQGKPLAEARGEVAMSAAYMLWFAEEARRVYGDVIPSPWENRRIVVTKEPVGVVGAITPWNFPSSMLARKIGPALATGCTVVAKPATVTPFSALAYGVLAEQVGIPAGVINIVTGSGRDIGGAITASPDVAKLTFTGSTEVGRVLLRQCADTVKKVSMELGGNAPFLVFDDADLDRAVEGAIAAKFRNTGQTCVCTNRLYVQAGVYETFLEKFTAAAERLKVGSGLDEGINQGPMIDRAALDKMEAFIDDARRGGARILTGGKAVEEGKLFYPPTILADVTPAMRLSNEEIFGPLLPVHRFDTEQEAIDLANATEFGLACYFYTNDLGRMHRVSEGLKFGLVGVNEGIITTEVAPFGGFKQSGFGKEGSKYGVDDYLNVKYTCIGGLGI